MAGGGGGRFVLRRLLQSDPISRYVKSERLMDRKGTDAAWDFQ